MNQLGFYKVIIYILLILLIIISLPLVFSVEVSSEQTSLVNDISTMDAAPAMSDSKNVIITASQTSNNENKNDVPDYQCLYPELYASNETVPGTLPETPKIAYLTFDDGPSDNTDIVLKTLKKEKVKATFFIMGCGVGKNGRKRIKKMAKEGHSIGIHTFSHDYHDIYSSVSSYLEDFNEIFSLVYDITGQKSNIFRFPGGSTNSYNKKIRKSLIEEMERRGFTYYDWNVSAEDAVGNPTKSSIRRNLLKAVNFKFPVLLMHDSGDSLAPAMLGDIIKELKTAGYKFDTLKNRVPIHFK